MPKKLILSISLLSGVLLTPASPLQAAVRPHVIGYLRDSHSISLTLNGQKSTFRIFAPDPSQMEEIEASLQALSWSLNRYHQTYSFQREEIRPVFNGQDYFIYHEDEPVLEITPTIARALGQSRLSALIELTNMLRKSMGTQPLRSFRYLSPMAGGETGFASWYGGYFHGRRTANGETYDINKFTAAHKALPFGTRVLVTNLENQQSVLVKINDRGPFKPSRIIDLSPEAFKQIGYLGKGVLRVKLSVLS
jgi:rare lipoprotein A (peptidoglycan hydrolase)